ncbi:hypothetical protein F8271_17800 [Micromonospora sp. ALFpr18c]|uniref:hypothetical protein n=1 Tax=Micromonospora sp. ALFpr18c TaxID=1458665 RepID=UPI00124B9CC0|nr:hypothetical protein [Micromonospora sp. ALFpr18c]KAB1938642.1 hypothetical protein F8271_17800 [Micromonospora sp. ALFpr18c]
MTVAEPTRPAEEPLTGGFVADVVRVGDTVRRTPPANLDFVGALLRHLAEVGADLAPRHLGVDDRGGRDARPDLPPCRVDHGVVVGDKPRRSG